MLGRTPLLVWRTILAAGEYKPALYLTRCLILLGFVQACTWLIPSDRLILRLAFVTPSIDFTDGLRYLISFILLV